MASRTVDFDVQQQPAHAAHVRLTPGLLDALRQAQLSGERAAVRFGDSPQSNAIVVGSSVFFFTALAQDACDLLHIRGPGDGSAGGASVVAAVRQKLMVHRNMQDERGRVRARAEEAEREKHERVAMVLDGSSKKANAKVGGKSRPPVAERTVRRVTPPPMQPAQQPTPPPAPAHGGQQPRVQPPAAAVLAPGTKPPAHSASVWQQGAAGAGAAPSPPAPKPLHKSASAGKLGAAGGAQTSGAAAVTPAVLAAARSGGLRACLLALLCDQKMSSIGLSAALKEVASRIRGFKLPQKDELLRAAKQVAEHRSPGLYVLHEWLREEAEALMAEARVAAPAAGRRRGATPPLPLPASGAGDSPEVAAASAPQPRSGQKKKKAAAGNKRRVESSPDEEGTEGSREAEPASAAVGQPGSGGAKRPRFGGAAAEAAAPRGASSSPLAGSAGGGGGGSGGRPRVKGSWGISSSSRESQDDSWVDEHAARQPLLAAPITTREEYEERQAAFTRDYEVYFRLHQMIESNKKDFRALRQAISSASSPGDRHRYEAQEAELWRKRGVRAKRWDAAFKVLHAELAALKARMADYVQSLQAPARQGGLAAGVVAAVGHG